AAPTVRGARRRGRKLAGDGRNRRRRPQLRYGQRGEPDARDDDLRDRRDVRGDAKSLDGGSDVEDEKAEQPDDSQPVDRSTSAQPVKRDPVRRSGSTRV